MTMHLDQRLTLTKTSRAKKTVTARELQEYTLAWRKHNKECRINYLHSMQFKTLDLYISYCCGVKYQAPRKQGKYQSIVHRSSNRNIPSHSSTTSVPLSRAPAQVYSGDRRLVGIAVMHKSNLVPVFEDDTGTARKEATELASMRR
jgi:hypothetical protein